MLLTTQLDSIKRLIKEKENEVIYYDPCENPEELSMAERAGALQDGQSVEVHQLSQRQRQLEARRGSLCARRARLRNLKDRCKENHRLRLQQAEASERYARQHHGIQKKRDKIREEEHKKKEWINQERQKTLQRLRAFKEKRPAGSALRTACSKPVAPDPSGGPSAGTPAPPAVPASPRKLTSALPPEVSNGKPFQGQACLGNGPAPVSVTVGDRTCSVSPEGLSPPPQPPPFSPAPPPPPPPLPPPLPSWSQAHPNPHFRTSVQDDQPLPLVCEPPALRPCGAPPSFGGPGSMEEVLASLRRGKTPLRKVDVPPAGPLPQATVNEDILAAIRQGVKLKKVPQDSGKCPSGVQKGTSELQRSIQAALQRIKRVAADSEEEDMENPGEWDQ